MTNDKPIGTIEHNGNTAFAVWTEGGPAIFPSMELLRECLAQGEITPQEGDREWYEAQGEKSPWHEVV